MKIGVYSSAWLTLCNWIQTVSVQVEKRIQTCSRKTLEFVIPDKCPHLLYYTVTMALPLSP